MLECFPGETFHIGYPTAQAPPPQAGPLAFGRSSFADLPWPVQHHRQTGSLSSGYCKKCNCNAVLRTCGIGLPTAHRGGLSGILSQTFQGRPATVRPIFLRFIRAGESRFARSRNAIPFRQRPASSPKARTANGHAAGSDHRLPAAGPAPGSPPPAPGSGGRIRQP